MEKLKCIERIYQGPDLKGYCLETSAGERLQYTKRDLIIAIREEKITVENLRLDQTGNHVEIRVLDNDIPKKDLNTDNIDAVAISNLLNDMI